MRKAIQTASDFFESTISSFPPATNVVLTLDPERFLSLNKELRDTNEKKWQVIHYFGNDLTFRKEYFDKSKDQNTPIILWITYPPQRKEGKIDLSYVYDIIEKAEKTIDLSLRDILSKIIPGETWPDEMFIYAKEIGNELSEFRSLHQALRKELPPKAPLNINHVKALVIALRNPQLPIEKLIFGSITPEEALDKYVALILSTDLNKDDTKLLKEIVENSLPLSFSEIAAWLELDSRDLATFLYLLDGAQRYQIPNPIIQLKGLGLLSFDPNPLNPQKIVRVLESIESRPDLRLCMIKIAEKNIGPKEIGKILDSSSLKVATQIAQEIQNEKSPLFAYTLCVHFLKEITKTKELNAKDLHWTYTIDSHPIIAEKIETEFSERAIETLQFLSGIASILQTMNVPFEPKNDIASLIDWYRESGFFKIELAIAKVNKCLKAIYDDTIRKTLAEQLSQMTRQAIKKVETADLSLAALIEKDWKSYLSHPRLATNIVNDHILKRGITPTKERRIWILIFDGMRLDAWEEIVKPTLSSKFELKEEKLYLTMLPSETDIARVAILAGASPADWADYEGGYASDHNILASRLFRLSKYEGKEKLRITVSSETDIGQKRLNEGSFLYNVLIYNLSDDWIHNFRGDICELNDSIKGTLERRILPDLEQRIGEKDYVILTSDHGFTELSPENGVKVYEGTYDTSKEIVKKPFIAYRHLKNLRHFAGCQIAYSNYESFTVAKGRKWFSREKGKFSRYAHGGISLNEMVIPAAVLEKITAPIVELILKYPDVVQLTEDESSKIEITIENVGNKETEFEMIMRTNIGEEKKHVGSLLSKETKQVDFVFAKPDLRLKHLEIALLYRAADGKIIRPQRKIIPISVKERKDKVEFRFGGLDKIGE
jgi:hypothetical protein